ncbi:MAG: hypothetical protein GF417_12215, partial [Candidatus Latescibacteria bacterium]|nr:hypothetical protein [bacterium]MBD3425192.1 hypothetical protein [Candidatus Latescibacterota bacterium]
MSIRNRLIIISVLIAVLPAVPLTVIVQNLLDKSFRVGISGTVSEALDNGMSISRKHLQALYADFEKGSSRAAGSLHPGTADSSEAALLAERISGVEGVIFPGNKQGRRAGAKEFPEELSVFADLPGLLKGRRVERRDPVSGG